MQVALHNVSACKELWLVLDADLLLGTEMLENYVLIVLLLGAF